MKGPVVLFTQELTEFWLECFLTLLVMTYGQLGDLFILLSYPEQFQGSRREFDAQMETDSYRKMKDWRTLLLCFNIYCNRSEAYLGRTGLYLMKGNGKRVKVYPYKPI